MLVPLHSSYWLQQYWWSIVYIEKVTNTRKKVIIILPPKLSPTLIIPFPTVGTQLKLFQPDRTILASSKNRFRLVFKVLWLKWEQVWLMDRWIRAWIEKDIISTYHYQSIFCVLNLTENSHSLNTHPHAIHSCKFSSWATILCNTNDN